MTVLSSHRSVAEPGRGAGWTGARIVSVVTGVLLALCSLGLLGVGGVALWAGHHPAARRRHRSRYLELPQHRLRRRQQHRGSVWGDRWPARAAVAARHRTDQRHAGSRRAGRCSPGITPAGFASRYLAGALAMKRSAASPVTTPSPPGITAAPLRPRPPWPGIWAAQAAGPGRPGPDLARPQRKVDGGRHERRRVTAGCRAHRRRRVAARTGLDRG